MNEFPSSVAGGVVVSPKVSVCGGKILGGGRGKDWFAALLLAEFLAVGSTPVLRASCVVG